MRRSLIILVCFFSTLFSWGQISYLGPNAYMVNAASIDYNGTTYICVVYSNGIPYNDPVDLKAIIFDGNGNIYFNGTFVSGAEIVLSLFIYGDPNNGRFYIYWDDETHYSGEDDSNIRYAILDVNSGLIRREWITNSSTTWYNVGKVVPEDYLGYTSPIGYVVWKGYDNSIGFSFAYMAKISPSGVLDIDTILAIPASVGGLSDFYLLYHKYEQCLYVIYNLDDPNTEDDIYATKYSLDGNELWPQLTEVCSYTDWQQLHTEEDVVEVVAQETGGFITAWEDRRNGDPYIYMQRMDENGNKLWGTYGTPLNFNYKVIGDIYLRCQDLYATNYPNDVFLTSGFYISGNYKSGIFLIDNYNGNILRSVIPNYTSYEEVIAKGIGSFGFSLTRDNYENEIYGWDFYSGDFEYYGILDLIPNELGPFMLVDNDYNGIAVAVKNNFLYAQPLVTAAGINEKQKVNPNNIKLLFDTYPFITTNYKLTNSHDITFIDLRGRRIKNFSSSGIFFIKRTSFSKNKFYKVIFIK